MAKGKHAPAPGAVRKDKVLHPESRKVKKLQAKEIRKTKFQMNGGGVGSKRLVALGEKLLWFHDNLMILKDDQSDFKMTKANLIELVEGYLNRFEDEIENIKTKNSLSKNRKFQHSNRLDAIELTIKTETDEFNGCGLELPNLFDSENFEYFNSWGGELRFVQNIKLNRFTRKELESDEDTMDCAN